MTTKPIAAFFTLLLGFTVGCLAAADSAADLIGNHTEEAAEVKVEVRQFHLGMIVRITLYAPSVEAGRQACRAAFRRVAVLDRDILSDYQPGSEVRQLGNQTGTGPVALSRELYTVLEAARTLVELTEGRFDPTAGPVIKLWRKARSQQSLPDPADLLQARETVGFQRLKLDADRRELTWSGPAPILDLGAIAKGFICDEVLADLRRQGIRRAMIEAGGDLVLGDPPPGTDGWPVELPHPAPGVQRLANCAVSISGDTSQYMTVDGVRHSHVIDARTGQALTHRRSCVAIAPTGLQSDALATAGTLIDPEAFQQLLREHYPGSRGWIGAPNGGAPGADALPADRESE